MTKNDLNLISGTKKSLSTANEAIEVIETELLTIYQTAEGNDTRVLALKASHEAESAKYHLLNVEKIINGKDEEPTMLDMFLAAKESMHDLWEFIADEYSSTDDVSMLLELEQAKNLISDADDILERAELRAEGHIKDSKISRIVLDTMGEYFTVDPTTTELRYTEIPEEYRK
jgi:hypothetical protein